MHACSAPCDTSSSRSARWTRATPAKPWAAAQPRADPCGLHGLGRVPPRNSGSPTTHPQSKHAHPAPPCVSARPVHCPNRPVPKQSTAPNAVLARPTPGPALAPGPGSIASRNLKNNACRRPGVRRISFSHSKPSCKSNKQPIERVHTTCAPGHPHSTTPERPQPPWTRGARPLEAAGCSQGRAPVPFHRRRRRAWAQGVAGVARRGNHELTRRHRCTQAGCNITTPAEQAV